MRLLLTISLFLLTLSAFSQRGIFRKVETDIIRMRTMANADSTLFLTTDSTGHIALKKISGSASPYHLPYNNDTTYVLAGDSTLHKLPTYTPFDSTSLSSRINQKQNKIKLTTIGQTGASTLINDTLNIPNYFFATNAGDSIDYSFSSMTAIYSEAGPGEATIGSSGVTANKDNLNFPFKQLKALDVGGWNAGDYVSFSWPTAKNSTSYTFLRGFVRLKQAVPIIQSLSFQFFNAGVAVSQILSMVNYGLDKSKVDVYQNITIPMSAFGFNTNGFDEIRLIFGGGSSASGLYLDLFQFQNATVEENKYLTDAFRSPGTLNVYGILGGQNKLLFTDSIGTPVDTTSLSNRINLKLNATDTVSLSNRINQKLNSSDTASLSSRINVKLNAADTASLSSRINLKEPTIAAGTTSQYWRGDKTWQTLTAGRFGIEDNTGVQDRLIHMGSKNLTIDSTGVLSLMTYQLNGSTSYVNRLLAGNTQIAMQAINVTGQTLSQVVVTPDWIKLTTQGGGVPAKIIAPSIASLTVSAPTTVAVWDNDTLKSAAIASISGGTSATVGTITWLGTTYNINSGNNITLATPTTSNISEGSNLYYTDARARAAISVTGGGTYNSTTGVINITGGSSSGWALGGNTLTNSGTEYLGTNNNTSFRLRTNFIQRMAIDSVGAVRLDVLNSATAGLSVYMSNVLRMSMTAGSGILSPEGYGVDNTTFLRSGSLQLGVNNNVSATAAIKASAATKFGLWVTNSPNSSFVMAAGDSGTIFNSSVSFRASSTTSTIYNVTLLDHSIFSDATIGAVTVNLPDASSASAVTSNIKGRVYVVKKTDGSGNTVTVKPSGSQTIDGATSYILSSQYKYVTIQSNGSNWFVIGNN